MKLLALLFLVGFAAASGEWEWNTSKEYVFEYRGRLITGFPKLATQYSGLGLRAKIVMKVLEPDHLLMVVEEPKSVEVNDILKPQGDSSTYGPEGTNWRHLELPSAQPVSEEFRRILSKPVTIRFAYDGEVTRMVFDGEEPEWSVNFKKGLISLFQTKINRFSMEIEENRLEELSLPLNGTNTWKIKEQSIDGICENQYSLSQLPKFYIKEHPETVPMPEACESPKRLFRITKLRNTENCEKRSIYSFFKPGYFNCRGEMGANCSPMWSRSSYTTYIACQSKDAPSIVRSSEYPTRRLVIQSVVNEAELSANLFGYSAEKITTGNRQILKLLEIRPRSEHHSESSISSPRTVTSLLYEFNRHDLLHQNGKHLGGNVLMNPEIVSKTNQHLFAKGAGVHISKEEIVGQIVELLTEVATDLKSSSSKIIEAHINMKLLGVSKGMAMLEEPRMFLEIYEKISGSPIMKNLFFDTVTISGTPVAIEFIKDMMISGKMTRMQKAQFFMWMPHYLVAPTTRLLHSLFDLVKSKAIQGPDVYPVVRGLAYSSLSRLIHTACISEDRLNSYPTWVYGEFCSPDSDIVNNHWVPFLKERIFLSRHEESSVRISTERDIAIMSLGMVGKKSVIPILLRVIQEKIRPRVNKGVVTISSTSRHLALYSLVSVGFREPHMVAPILMSILRDSSETLEMRVAAFNGLMRMGPPSVHILQDIVGMTHQEVGLDLELLKVINTGLYSAGHQELHPNMGYRMVEMIKNAKMAYHMVNKIKGIYPTSATFFTNAYLEKLGVGYDSFLTYVRSQEGFLPKHIFAEIKYLLLNFNIKPIEFGLSLGSRSGLHEKLAEVLASKEKLQEAIKEHLTEGLNSGWRNIVQQLKEEAVVSRSDEMEESIVMEERDPSLFIKLFESSFLYFNLDSLTSGPTAKHLIKELLHHIKSDQPFVAEKSIEMQRVMDLVPFMVIIPSDMGFPINIRLHYPMTFSFSGNVKTHLTASTQSLDISGKIAFASQLTGYVGTRSPFTKELICTGVDQHSVMELPGQIRIKASIPDQKLTVEIGRMDSESHVDVMHFHVIPFTVRNKLTSLKPLVKSPHFKSIESDVKPYEKEMTIGEPLGLALRIKYKTESAFNGLSSIWELMSSYNRCPWNMMAFGWVSPSLNVEAKPSIRKYRYTASLDTSASTTKEIKMEFKLGYSSKKRSAGSQVLYHRIHVLPQLIEAIALSNEAGHYYNEGVEGYESPIVKIIKKNLPYRIRSEPLEQALASHPNRVQKIKNVLENILLKTELADSSSSASAITLMSTVALEGSPRPVLLKYAITFGYGSSSSKISVRSPEYLSAEEHRMMKMEQKWSMELEGFKSKKMCMSGYLRFPILPMWNVNDLKTTLSTFELKNFVGVGESDCKESSVETTGRFIASEKQRKHGLKSLEAEECLRLTSTHGHSYHDVCKKAIDLATTVDMVEIDNKFKNVMPWISRFESRVVNFLRGYLWPYLAVDKRPSSHERELRTEGEMTTYETKTKIELHASTPSFDMVIKRPMEELYFENVHIRSPYSIFFPLMTGRRFDSSLRSSSIIPTFNKSYKSLYSLEGIHHKHIIRNSEEYSSSEMNVLDSSYYKCTATPEFVTSYKNKTIPYKKYFGCEHLLTGDCGTVKHFFVSEIMEKSGKKIVKINLRDAEVKIKEESTSTFEVLVDGRKVMLVDDSEIDLKDESGKTIGTVFYRRSNNGFPLKVMLPKYYLDEIFFDGRVLEIMPSPKMKTYPMCGLCGSLKSPAHMSRNQVCKYSSHELTQASNRINSVSDECPSLEQPLREQLKREKELCLQNTQSNKYYQQYPHLNEPYHHGKHNFEVSEDQCSILRHIIHSRSDDVCISKTPLVHCGHDCKSAEQHVEKTVHFICLPKGRMAEYYVKKVQEGKILKELYSMEESFTKKMHQVHHCIPTA